MGTKDSSALNAYLSVHADGHDTICRCEVCDAELGKIVSGYKDVAHERRRPVSDLGVRVSGADEEFEVREYSCPSCGVLLDVEVAKIDDPILQDSVVNPAGDGG